jgi:hypothetical protein
VNTEDNSNNFIGVRHMAGSVFGDSLYAEFQTGNLALEEISFSADKVDFIELYNCTADSWQMNNLYNHSEQTWRQGRFASAQQQHPNGSTTPLDKLHEKLHQWLGCRGETCA